MSFLPSFGKGQTVTTGDVSASIGFILDNGENALSIKNEGAEAAYIDIGVDAATAVNTGASYAILAGESVIIPIPTGYNTLAYIDGNALATTDLHIIPGKLK